MLLRRFSNTPKRSMYEINKTDSDEVKSLKETIKSIDESPDILDKICGAAQDLRYECERRLIELNKANKQQWKI